MIDLEIDLPGVKPIAGERWRYCVGYEGSYAVSSEGRVASLPTVSEIVNGKRWAHTLPPTHPRYLPPAHPVNASYTTA